MRGTEIKAGDKIQVSCVFDSTDSTFFAFSTYDEMCITFETPASLLASNNHDDTYLAFLGESTFSQSCSS
jgi:hypothetical protein